VGFGQWGCADGGVRPSVQHREQKTRRGRGQQERGRIPSSRCGQTPLRRGEKKGSPLKNGIRRLEGGSPPGRHHQAGKGNAQGVKVGDRRYAQANQKCPPRTVPTGSSEAGIAIKGRTDKGGYVVPEEIKVVKRKIWLTTKNKRGAAPQPTIKKWKSQTRPAHRIGGGSVRPI